MRGSAGGSCFISRAHCGASRAGPGEAWTPGAMNWRPSAGECSIKARCIAGCARSSTLAVAALLSGSNGRMREGTVGNQRCCDGDGGPRTRHFPGAAARKRTACHHHSETTPKKQERKRRALPRKEETFQIYRRHRCTTPRIDTGARYTIAASNGQAPTTQQLPRRVRPGRLTVVCESRDHAACHARFILIPDSRHARGERDSWRSRLQA